VNFTILQGEMNAKYDSIPIEFKKTTNFYLSRRQIKLDILVVAAKV
jgi:hypothetical protein